MPKGGPDFYYFWSRKGARFANLLLHSASSLFTLFTLFFSCIFVLCKMWQIPLRGLVTASPSRVIDCTTFNLQFLPPTSHGEAGRERRRPRGSKFREEKRLLRPWPRTKRLFCPPPPPSFSQKQCVKNKRGCYWTSVVGRRKKVSSFSDGFSTKGKDPGSGRRKIRGKSHGGKGRFSITFEIFIVVGGL